MAMQPIKPTPLKIALAGAGLESGALFSDAAKEGLIGLSESVLLPCKLLK